MSETPTSIVEKLLAWDTYTDLSGESMLYRGAALAVLALLLAVLWAILRKQDWDPFSTKERGFLGRFTRRFAVLLLLAICVNLQINVILKERKFKLVEDTLYLPDPQTVKLVAVGYDELLADVLFLRAIQAYGGGWQFSGKGGRPKLFEHYFNVITDLDPTFTRAYTFGNMLVGEEMRAPAPALGLMQKGVILNPGSYRVAYEGGFFAADRLQDYERAAYYLRWAVQAPDVPNWVERQIYYFMIREGQFRHGFERYLRLYLEALRDEDRIIEQISRTRLISTMSDWGVDILMDAIDMYFEAHGEYPPDLRTLIEAGDLVDYEFIDARALFDPDQVSAALIGVRAPLIEMLPQDLSIEEQIRWIMDRITYRAAGLPVTFDRKGWWYKRTDEGMLLQEMTRSLELSELLITYHNRGIATEMSLTGIAPPTIAKVIETIAGFEPATIHDPLGTFVLYNPGTAQYDYWSGYWEE